MPSTISHRIIIAENSPIISGGIAHVLRRLPGYRPQVTVVENKENLIDEIATEEIAILIASPGFGGLLHPDEIRKKSLNPGIRVIAIETGKMSRQALALYDDHIHITDDIETLRKVIIPPVKENESSHEEKEVLSAREKEIVRLVVKGFTNQEIADKLYLSVHTVITHRRNISRKLEIHSATGLTIYAIVNKIVDLSDIKL